MKSLCGFCILVMVASWNKLNVSPSVFGEEFVNVIGFITEDAWSWAFHFWEVLRTSSVSTSNFFIFLFFLVIFGTLCIPLNFPFCLNV